ncbi:MAG: peptidylprolyl isomerase [Myxococcales bacterium]|nr:peptidylprolyl isomerase [Myxococcales bacterium]
MKRAFAFVLVSACGAPAPAPPPRTVLVATPAEPAETAPEPPAASCTPAVREPRPIRPPKEVPQSPDDPLGGRFELADAIRGLSGGWPLVATLETSEGDLECTLWDQVAPRTVASFVGLARGLRPWREPKTGAWRARPAYDGSSFHRVIPGFMIQGGDPLGTGSGEPGFLLPDEIDESIHSDRRGLLFMANRGPDTNGMQFFVLDAPAPHIDGRYTAFGECEPGDVISGIARVPTGAGDRPVTPVSIERVRIAFKEPCR